MGFWGVGGLLGLVGLLRGIPGASGGVWCVCDGESVLRCCRFGCGGGCPGLETIGIG